MCGFPGQRTLLEYPQEGEGLIIPPGLGFELPDTTRRDDKVVVRV